MLNLTPNAAAAITKSEQVEPIYLLWLNFGLPMGAVRIASRTVSAGGFTWNGNLISHGDLSNVSTVDSATIGSISFSISDAYKSRFDGTNPEMIQAYVYIYFPLEVGDPTLILRGKVLSTYTWDEQSKEIKLEVESDIFSQELGYSIQAGDFNSQNDVAINKPWPIVFGTAAHVPAAHVQTKPKATLKYPITFAPKGLAKLYTTSDDLTDVKYNGFVLGQLKKFELVESATVKTFKPQGIVASGTDADLEENAIYLNDADAFPQNTDITISVDGVHFKGALTGNRFAVSESNASRYPEANLSPAPDGGDSATSTVDSEFLSFRVPAGYNVIGNYLTIETPSGNRQVRKCIRQVDDLVTIDRYVYEATNINLSTAVINSRKKLGTDDKLVAVRVISPNGLADDIYQETRELKKSLDLIAFSPNAEEGQEYATMIKVLEELGKLRNAFWERDAGTEVSVEGPEWFEYYVANMVPSTSIKSVYALRNGHFTPVPKKYYTVSLNQPSNTGHTVTAIKLLQPLSELKDQGWEDDLYVTVESTLPNNAASVIKWILQNHTNIIPDTTFDTLVTHLSKYPTNFYYARVENSVQVAQNIAWQARCSLRINGLEASLIYLSEEPTEVFAFDEDNIQYTSLSINNTSPEDLVTRFVAKWQPDGYTQKEYVFANNLNIYGVREREYEIYIYNNFSLVQKTVNFWGTRYSNIWKKVSFTGFHDCFHLEPFDPVTIQFGVTFFLHNLNPIKSVITETRYAGIDTSITLWLPILSGKIVPFDDAWFVDDNDTAPANHAEGFEELDYSIEKIPASLSDQITLLKDLQATTKVPVTFESEAKEMSIGVVTLGKILQTQRTVRIEYAGYNSGRKAGDVVSVKSLPTGFSAHMEEEGWDNLFYIHSVHDIFLRGRFCRIRLSGDPPVSSFVQYGGTLNVYKPVDLWSSSEIPELQPSDFPNKRFIFTSPNTRILEKLVDGNYEHVENQRITSDYLEPGIIEVKNHSFNVVDLAGALGEGNNGWWDTNTSGRHWAQVPPVE